MIWVLERVPSIFPFLYFLVYFFFFLGERLDGGEVIDSSVNISMRKTFPSSFFSSFLFGFFYSLFLLEPS